MAGFRTVVIDDREMFANRDRFPEADEIFADEYENIFPKLPINETSYIVIVTRGHRDDMRVLKWAVSTNARYIAMIGSKRKVIGVDPRAGKRRNRDGSAFDRIFAPMGFDIGAITPEEIAVAVVAEMIAVRRNPRCGLEAAFEVGLSERETSGAPDVKTAAIILAGGASGVWDRLRRCCHSKAVLSSNLSFTDFPRCDQTVVVLGHDSERIRAGIRADATFVVNPHPERGQLTSLQCGLASSAGRGRGVLYPG